MTANSCTMGGYTVATSVTAVGPLGGRPVTWCIKMGTSEYKGGQCWVDGPWGALSCCCNEEDFI
jgi:hypothetical protein